MRFRFLISSLSFAVLASSVAAAQMTSGSASSANRFAKDYFNGTWTCKTTASADKSMIGKSETITFAASGQYWQKITYAEGTTWVTYDAKLKKYVGETIGVHGDYGMGESSGWTDDKFIVKDTVNAGGRPLGALTFTRKSATEYTDEYVVQGKVFGADTCTKQAA